MCNAGDPGLIPEWGRSSGEGIGYPLQYSWASLVAQLINRSQCRIPGFNAWVGKIPWRMERLPTPVFWPGEFHGWYSPVHGVCYTHTCTHIQRLKGFVYFKAGNKIALDHYHCINILVRVRAKHCWRLHFLLYKSSVTIPVLKFFFPYSVSKVMSHFMGLALY